MKLTLRSKLLVLSVALAVVPLGVAGRTLIRITQDELKSAANDDIARTAVAAAHEVDVLYLDSWLAPLRLVASAVDSPHIGGEEKLSLLRASLQTLPDVVSLQVNVLGIEGPLVVSRDDFTQRLASHGENPGDVLTVPSDTIASMTADGSGEPAAAGPDYLEASEDWLLTIAVPLANPVAGRQAVLSARIDLGRLQRYITTHPFAAHGELYIVDADGRRLFDPANHDLSHRAVVADALALLGGESRPVGVRPYQQPGGEATLAGYAFPTSLSWAVVLERSESDAYLAVTRMRQSLYYAVLVGLAIAILGALGVAVRISRPVEQMAEVARRVGEGDLDVQVRELRQQDEIGTLARRINEMIRGLRERDFIRDTFGRYVSPDVAQQLLSDPEALALGGEVREITVMFSDLRGFTALAERRTPAEMVTLLNAYLGRMSEVIERHGGTVLEFIGDGIMTVFGAPVAGSDDVERAVACAADMQVELEQFNLSHATEGQSPLTMGIGLATGPVIVGNIGSATRVKYGVVGDDVNLAARIESFTLPGEVLVSQATHDATVGCARYRGPIEVQAKGKKASLRLYALTAVDGSDGLIVPSEHREPPAMAEVTGAVELAVITGKEVSSETVSGQLLRLGAESAEIETPAAIDLFTNVRIEIRSEDGRVGRLADVYAKVVAEDATAAGHRLRVVFTALPEGGREVLGHLVG